jgi:iron(III) transport system ATP-binding protein
VLKGKNVDERHIEFGGRPLRCSGPKLPAGGESAISIRQHDIRIHASQPQSADNVVQAKVVRHVFLGGSRDYLVEVANGTQLRVVTSAAESIPQGSTVWLHLPPDRCRALTA